MISGGGALAAPVEKFWNALGIVLVQGYGMTETTALITLNHPFHVASGTIGKPLAGREVKLGADGEVLVKGAMISGATWQGGELTSAKTSGWRPATWPRCSPPASSFIGRKSEVIVTASGVNLHPEDMEAAVEEQPGVAACAVVPIETAAGPEACAVLAVRGAGEQAAAVERANAKLAEYQRIRRWVLFPEPDLPRTSTGKVRRKAVESWLTGIQTASTGAGPHAEAFSPQSDWLLALIAQITGEKSPGIGDELRLGEDLHLDSLGRVQLAAAIEQKLGMAPESSMLDTVQTLGELRAIVSGAAEPQPAAQPPAGTAEPALSLQKGLDSETRETKLPSEFSRRNHVYPHWPWRAPFTWIRGAFIEAAMRPLVWLLANPRVQCPANLAEQVHEPILIVANHITAYDAPLIQYALPGSMRRAIAAAMSAEMLDGFRRFRNPDWPSGKRGFYPFGALAWLFLTGLFNVFPLPRLRDFQRSFAHAGEALDRGYNVLVFPEGTRSAAGRLAPFRAGIGLLVRQATPRCFPSLCGAWAS